MGCVSSTLLNQDEDFSQIGGAAALSHHIVSLTSTTYGLLTLDPPPPVHAEKHFPTIAAPPPPTPPPPPPRTALGSLFPSPLSEPRSLKYQPLQTLDSWDHIPSFHFSPIPFVPSKLSNPSVNKQALISHVNDRDSISNVSAVNSSTEVEVLRASSKDLLDGFEMICPPNGENKVVIYTTTLRGVRKTFDDCNAVRSAIEGVGVSVSERDISMDRGFRDELRELMKGKGINTFKPPRVFVKGRYLGGVEEVLRMVEEGCLGQLLEGLPRVKREGFVCEGCGGLRFLPCSICNGSCKMTVTVTVKGAVIVICSNCNENGLVVCPVCT